jgi:hypothetical protein
VRHLTPDFSPFSTHVWSTAVNFQKATNFAKYDSHLVNTVFRTLSHVIRNASEKRRKETIRQVMQARLVEIALFHLRAHAGKKKLVRAIFGFLQSFMNCTKDGSGFDVDPKLFETVLEIFGQYLTNEKITDRIMGFLWASAFTMKSSVPPIAANVNLFSQFILTSKSEATVHNCFGIINNLFSTYVLTLDQQKVFGKALMKALKEWSEMELVFQVASQYFQSSCCAEQKAKFVNDGV